MRLLAARTAEGVAIIAFRTMRRFTLGRAACTGRFGRLPIGARRKRMTLRLYRSDGQRNREHGYGKYLQHSSLPIFVYSNTTRTIYCAGEIDVQLPLHRVRHLGDL